MGDHGARQLSPLFARRLIKRTRQGSYQLNLGDSDRDLLRQLAPQFRQLLEDPSQPALRRLFPPAYLQPNDEELAEEYRRLMTDDLVDRHRDEFDLLESTATAHTLSEEQLLAWSRALNTVRLIVGTALDVTEEDEQRSPTSSEEALYQWLTYLLGEAIDALSGDADDRGLDQP